MGKQELLELIRKEEKIYDDYMFKSRWRKFIGAVKCEPIYYIKKWQKISRKTDYYKKKFELNNAAINSFLYLYYIRKRNKLALKLGIEIETANIGEGFVLYHYGATVINPSSVIGKNCHLHGNNCIGNAGPHNHGCPIIGDNVMLGVGAKVIGPVKIANNTIVAAGAVVVNSFEEEGVVLAGIPAKKVKRQ